MVTTTEQVRTTTEDFDAIYAGATGQRGSIPWDDARPHPGLVSWLNAVAPSLIRCGARVAVVGCGLGDDAEELCRRGYEVTAFDVSPAAVRWARDLHPEYAHCFHVADLFDHPARWRHRFDLVVEINTIQALSPDRRGAVMAAISDLLSPRGRLLVICRGADEPVMIDDGPPWAMTREELEGAAAVAGLVAEDICCYVDSETPPVARIRALFQRGG